MDVLKFVVLIVAVFAQVYCALGTPTSDDGDIWSIENWQRDPLESGLVFRVADLIKRSNSQQFHRLIGRSSGVPQPIPLEQKRYKGDIFVGLMGRRSSSGGSQAPYQMINMLAIILQNNFNLMYLFHICFFQSHKRNGTSPSITRDEDIT
uniref:Tachykinin precursor 1 n=1 Tax=Salmo trutta TaxID=8032 RepID=A0A673ZC60_SALTR